MLSGLLLILAQPASLYHPDPQSGVSTTVGWTLPHSQLVQTKAQRACTKAIVVGAFSKLRFPLPKCQLVPRG